MGKGVFHSVSVAGLAWAVAAVSLVAADAPRPTVAPVQVTPLGDASGSFQLTNPKTSSAAPSSSRPAGSGFSASPASGKMLEMPKMFDGGKGDLSDFNAQRSPFDGKASPFDMKASNLSDKRAEIGGRPIYAPMLDTFDKRIDVPQASGFQAMSPMSGAATTAAGGQVSSFDAKRATGFDKTITVPDYRGREADAILNPKPFAEAMKGGDPATAQFIRGGGSYGATISLEEVRDMINKDVKGASLQIPLPDAPKR